MDETVTYLEMTSPGELRPADPVPEVTLELLDRTSPLIRSTTVRIGLPYRWPSSTWSDAQWNSYLADPRREYWIIRHHGEIAGLADFQGQADRQLEITTFGLVPKFVGRRIGGYALTLVVEKAFDGDVRRVWLHTSDLDHPNALPNYRSRGFRTFRTERGKR